MHIVYIASVRIPNEKASGLAIMRQCEGFVDAGHTVTLFRPNRINHIKEDAFSYYGIKKYFTIDKFPIIQLYDSLGKTGFVLTRLSSMVSVFFKLFKYRNKDLVIYSRDQWMIFLPLIFGFKNKFIWEAHTKHTNWITTFVSKKVTKLVVISIGLKYFYSYNRKSIIQVEPSGVDLKQFKNLPSKTDLKHKYGLPPQSIVVGYIGKFTTMGEEKGVRDLVRAFAEAVKENQKLHLMLVGGEEDENNILINEIDKLGIGANNYTLLTLNPKYFAEYAYLSDILVANYPDTEHYRKYMSPVKLFAYLASGNPVVSSDLPSIRSITDDSMMSFFKANSILSLSEVIVDVSSNYQTYVIKANSILEKVTMYSWKKRALRIMDYN